MLYCLQGSVFFLITLTSCHPLTRFLSTEELKISLEYPTTSSTYGGYGQLKEKSNVVFCDISLLCFITAPCKPGHFSKDGLEPCSECELGYYQERSMKTVCTQCVGGGFGGKKAATSQNDCPSKWSNRFSSFPHK